MTLYIAGANGTRQPLTAGTVLVIYSADGTQQRVQIGNPNQIVGASQFGSPTTGSYAEFEGDGTLRLYGAATVWLDALGSIIGSRLESPASDIVQNNAEGSITFESGARYATDYVTYNLQFNHYRKLASATGFHIHWWQTNAAMPNWIVGYRWQKNGAAKTTSWTNLPWSSNIFTYSAGTLNQITEFGDVVIPSGDGLSDILQIRLYRDYNNDSGLFAGAETSGIDVDVLYGDSHIEIDSMGSRQEYSK